MLLIKRMRSHQAAAAAPASGALPLGGGGGAGEGQVARLGEAQQQVAQNVVAQLWQG